MSCHVISSLPPNLNKDPLSDDTFNTVPYCAVPKIGGVSLSIIHPSIGWAKDTHQRAKRSRAETTTQI